LEFIIYEKHDSYCSIIINNPKQLNALNTQVLSELNAALLTAEQDNEVLAVIISGAGGKAFIAGADISAMQNMTVKEAQEFAKLGQAIFNRIELMRKPVIAAIDGFALGGGCELALACDLRICSDKSKFGQPEINLGIIPGFGGTQRLTRLIGKSTALKLILTGDIIDAEEAYRLGLVDQVVSAEQVIATATALAKKIAAKAPYAIAQAKEAVNYANGYRVAGCEYEATLFAGCFATEDQIEGMTAFLEKRKPVFKGV
jgi:enoyl-CoA hydratase